MKIVLLGFLTLLMFAGSADAQSSRGKRSELADAHWELVRREDIYKINKVERGKFSVRIEEICTSGSRRVPRISPREESWLDGEIASKHDGRVSAAVRSLEYAQRNLKDEFDNCAFLARSAKIGAKFPHIEAGQWLRLAMLLIDADFTYSAEALKSGKGIKVFESDDDPSLAARMLGKQIVESIVLPILDAL